MFDKIKNCNKCGLCKHQKPLIDEVNDCQAFWVGLSAKISTCEGERPLSPTTNSGSILCKVEDRCPDITMYRTNLVKCAPLNEAGKLRYPNRHEIDLCLPHLATEIDELAPRIVFLLGGKVIEAIGKYYAIEFKKWNDFAYIGAKYKNMQFIPVHHPSYIYVYRRKRINEYIGALEKAISCLA